MGPFFFMNSCKGYKKVGILGCYRGIRRQIPVGHYNKLRQDNFGIKSGG